MIELSLMDLWESQLASGALQGVSGVSSMNLRRVYDEESPAGHWGLL